MYKILKVPVVYSDIQASPPHNPKLEDYPL
jgi:hypothetical protein